MAVCILELNDSELRCARGRDIILRSPGYAIARDGGLLLGEDALHAAHLHPRQTFDRFWLNLSQDALPAPVEGLRHHADLVFAHLRAIHERAGKPAELIFAVPGSFSTDQMSLLLGIAQACSFSTVGLVDNAVAAASVVAAPGRYQHVDLHLHRAVITELEVTGGEVIRGDVDIVDSAGIAALHAACAEAIADIFIKQSRFDPQHHAATEQALFDQIPGCLRALNDRHQVHLDIQYEGVARHARLDRDALVEGLAPVYRRIIDRLERGRSYLLADRAAVLPGFRERLTAHETLAAESVFAGCMQHQLRIRSDGEDLSYITRLPATESPAPTAATAAAAPEAVTMKADTGRPATHVMHDHRAIALDDKPLYLCADGGVSRTGGGLARCAVRLNGARATVDAEGDAAVLVNGRRLDGSGSLSAGDTVGFEGSDANFSFIAVESGHGP